MLVKKRAIAFNIISALSLQMNKIEIQTTNLLEVVTKIVLKYIFWHET